MNKKVLLAALAAASAGLLFAQEFRIDAGGPDPQSESLSKEFPQARRPGRRKTATNAFSSLERFPVNGRNAPSPSFRSPPVRSISGS